MRKAKHEPERDVTVRATGRMVGRGLGHLAPDMKRARMDAEEAADGAADGRVDGGAGRDGCALQSARTDQPAFHVGVGVDDVAAEA